MKTSFRSLAPQLLWQVCHAVALGLISLVLFERLVPGAVLGHLPLFIGVPLLILCLTFHPIAHKPTRWWLLVDLWIIALLSMGRVLMQYAADIPLAWLTTVFALLLVLAFVWIFSRDAAKKS